MEVLRTAAALRAWRDGRPSARRIGFVPTMGYLHAGHLSLIAEARRRVPPAQGDVVVSIFVNPTQFGPGEDLEQYPRDEAGDLDKARAAGVDVVFCPQSVGELYPSPATWVAVDRLGQGLCGVSRPEHFRGVTTVVTKLWNLVRPDIAVFGQKDYQQLAIVRRMHADLFLCGEVVGMPIVREPDGLAMSSRNAYLGPEARGDALRIKVFLDRVQQRFAEGERGVDQLVAGADEALAPGTADYVEVVDAADLSVINRVDRPALCAIAAHFGGVRLIDNVVLHP